MGRLRFIHPDIWTDPAVGSLSPIERLLFIGLFSNADDEGRLPGNPAYLRSTIFPYDDFTNEQVKAMRDNVASTCSNVAVYIVNKVEYIALLKWREYQSPRYAKPSKYPAPDCANFATKSLQACNQIAASLQPNRDNLATMDSDSDSDLDSDSDSTSTPTPSSEVPYNEIIKAYNTTCTGLSKVVALTDARRKAIRARWNAHPDLEAFKQLFDQVARSDFLNGSNDKNWRADFDWLMKEQNLIKVLEGKYERRMEAKTNGGNDRAGIRQGARYVEQHREEDYEQFCVS